MWYYLKQTRSQYIYIYIYTHTDTQDTPRYIQVGIQGVSHIKYNAINCINKSSSMQKEQYTLCLQILEFFTI